MSERRALTLVEILVALSLLTVVAGATGVWLRTSAAATAMASTSTRFDSAAEAVLRLIEEDIAVGDFPKRTRRRSSQEPTVNIDGASLRIRSRADGEPCICSYELQRFQLRRVEVDSSGASSFRVLMDDVADMRMELTEENRDGERMLTVELEAGSGRSRSREYLVP